MRQDLDRRGHALDVEVEPLDRVVVGAAAFQPTRPFRMETLNEAFNVYEGETVVRIPVTFMLVDGGNLEVAVRVSMQACSATDCLPPRSTRLVLRISESPLVERPQPKAT